MQPFLGAICPILIVSDVRLEFIYLVVGGAEPIRETLSSISGVLELSLSHISRLVNKSKNRIACSVQLISF
jgi:hypothetical protein